MRGTDDGIWRRLAPIPFNVSFTGDRLDKSLGQKLAQEKSGILNWLLEGCKIWMEDKLKEPQVVAEAISAYRSDSDNVLRFLELETVPDRTGIVPISQLYLGYKNWIADEGEHYTASNKEFKSIVSNQTHIEESRTSRARVWRGIKLA